MNPLISLAAKNISDILRDAIQLKPTEHTVVIYDTTAPLAQILTDGYREALPDGEFIDFATMTPKSVMEKIRSLKEGDLVVLVQSMNFRLNEFRIRIELFARGLKTIEHIHLARMSEDQFEIYLNALAYNKDYYRALGKALKEKLDAATKIVVECFGGTKLVYDTRMEDAKLNVGDYTTMKNVGGTFPIGEVFSEAINFDAVNGDVMIFGYADKNHFMKLVEPFPAHIEKSMMTAPNAPEEFQEILNMIAAEEDVVVREFGLSLNPAMSKTNMVNDVTAFERHLGLHLSLGEKHTVYPKEGYKRKTGRYHVDVFIDVERILVNESELFANGKYQR